MRTRDKQRIFKRFMAGFPVSTLAVRLSPAAQWSASERLKAEELVEQAIRDCVKQIESRAK